MNHNDLNDIPDLGNYSARKSGEGFYRYFNVGQDNNFVSYSISRRIHLELIGQVISPLKAILPQTT